MSTAKYHFPHHAWQQASSEPQFHLSGDKFAGLDAMEDREKKEAALAIEDPTMIDMDRTGFEID